jgi:hypothetical protein
MSTRFRWVEVFTDNPDLPVAQTFDYNGRHYWKLQYWEQPGPAWQDVPIEHNPEEPAAAAELKRLSPQARHSPGEHTPENSQAPKPDSDPPQENKAGQPQDRPARKS